MWGWGNYKKEKKNEIKDEEITGNCHLLGDDRKIRWRRSVRWKIKQNKIMLLDNMEKIKVTMLELREEITKSTN